MICCDFDASLGAPASQPASQLTRLAAHQPRYASRYHYTDCAIGSACVNKQLFAGEEEEEAAAVVEEIV